MQGVDGLERAPLQAEIKTHVAIAKRSCGDSRKAPRLYHRRSIVL